MAITKANAGCPEPGVRGGSPSIKACENNATAAKFHAIQMFTGPSRQQNIQTGDLTMQQVCQDCSQIVMKRIIQNQ